MGIGPHGGACGKGRLGYRFCNPLTRPRLSLFQNSDGRLPNRTRIGSVADGALQVLKDRGLVKDFGGLQPEVRE